MAREVVEEIGWEAESLESLNCILTSPGFSNQQMHLFVVHLSRHVGTRHEATEKINVHVLDWDDVRGMMERQENKRRQVARGIVPVREPCGRG